MARLLFGVIVLVALITVFTIVDCLRIDRARVRVFPRIAWFFIILLVPVIGAALWFVFGRGRRHQSRNRPVRRTVGPDDDPDFLRRMNPASRPGSGTRPAAGPARDDDDVDTEARLRELEQRLAEVDDEQDPGRTER